MADLKTNYVDDVLDTTKNQLRKYQQIQNDDGTVSFVDVTEYTQVGTSFGAKDINDTNAAINYVNGKLNYKQDKDYTRLEYSFTEGISFGTDWNEGIIECIFGANPNSSFTIPITKRMFDSGRSNIILPFGHYMSASDCHGGYVELTKSVIIGKTWIWAGKDYANTSRIAIYYR